MTVCISQLRLNDAVVANNLKHLSDLQNKGLFFPHIMYPVGVRNDICSLFFNPYLKRFVLGQNGKESMEAPHKNS